ncbi:hypothetical protein DW651_09145 [Subdoligranulum sp. AM23-21AC]|nr:hypothetical protein DW651_09145 [Subdoligranulum sp. AM23-21AC]RJW32314.1 hypothetical protein DXC43_05420 [Subdoligranulum sp. TF05-17AC]
MPAGPPAAYINRYKSAWQAGFRAARPGLARRSPGLIGAVALKKTPPKAKTGRNRLFLGFVNPLTNMVQ